MHATKHRGDREDTYGLLGARPAPGSVRDQVLMHKRDSDR